MLPGAMLPTGVIAPGATVASLIGANVVQGATGQSADPLNDFKLGQTIAIVG